MDSISISSELSVSTPSSLIIIDDDGTKEFFHHSNIKDKIINSRRRHHRDEKDDIINSRPQDLSLYNSHNDSIVALIEKKTKHRHKRKEEEHTTIETESRRRSSSVSFSTCYVRQFDIVVGDNPSVYKGPPIQLGWNYTDYEMDVNEYETNHAGHRPLKQLLLSPNDRKDILYASGKYTTNDLHRATKEANIVKKQRQNTNKTLRNPIYRNFDIAIERARRMYNRIVKKKIPEDIEKLDRSTITSTSAGSYNSRASSILKGGTYHDERRLSTTSN